MVLLGDVGQVEALSVCLEIVLISALGGCTVCAECTTGLGDVGQVEARFGPFRDNVDLSTGWVHGLRRMYHGPRNHFWQTQWYS
jgi:hypothetical protein